MGSPFRSLIAIAVLAAIMGGLLACMRQGKDSEQKAGRMAEVAIESVLKQHTDQLLSLPGVVGTAIGECESRPCIKVFVIKKTPALMKQIPSTLEGFPVVIEETGEIKALDQK